MRKIILESLRSEWQKKALTEGKRRRAKGLGKFYRSTARNSIPNFQLKHFNFGEYKRITQVGYFQARARMGNFLFYLAKSGKANSNICNLCNKEKQTGYYLVLQFPRYKAERKKAFDKIYRGNLFLIFNPSIGKMAMLSYLDSSGCLSCLKS